jgi:hypothetical protein
VDDTSLLPSHNRQHRSNGIEIAEVVDFQLSADFLDGSIDEGFVQRQAGIVYQDINPTPLPDNLLDD